MESTKVSNFKINVLTQEQYDSSDKDKTQLYLIKDANLTTLPKVTTEDNGKILQVVNGVWTLKTPTTETWTFELEDGTSVEKTVVLS